MSEQEVCWVGRRPSTDQPPALPAEDPAFEATLREICDAAGCPVQRYIAARGAFGSWLLELSRDGQTQRLIWNGKASRLSIDAPNRAGGWNELSAETLERTDTEAVFAAMQRILGNGPVGD
jgi:hypothetical protein